MSGTRAYRQATAAVIKLTQGHINSAICEFEDAGGVLITMQPENIEDDDYDYDTVAHRGWELYYASSELDRIRASYHKLLEDVIDSVCSQDEAMDRFAKICCMCVHPASLAKQRAAVDAAKILGEAVWQFAPSNWHPLTSRPLGATPVANG